MRLTGALLDDFESARNLERLLEQPYADAGRRALEDLSKVHMAILEVPTPDAQPVARALLWVALRLCARAYLPPDGWISRLAADLGVDLDRALEAIKERGAE